MGKAVRLSDIAQRAGVSIVTVSKALSGQKGVSEEKRKQIEEIADELGYRKIVSGAGSEERKTHTIGVIIAERFLDENQSFYWTFYQEISKYAVSRNCFAMLEVIGLNDEKGRRVPRMMEENQIEGLIILGSFTQGYEQSLGRTVSVPVVYLDTVGSASGCDCVVTNNLMGGYTMTNYLLRMGHRKIGFVGTLLAMQSIDDRYLGYLKALMEHGIEVNPDYVIDDRGREKGDVDPELYFSLPSDDMPTAFFCNCDGTASCLIEKLRRQGYAVPDDISVAGFDDFAPDQWADVALTTCSIRVKDMAKRAVHILVHKIEGKPYSSGIHSFTGTFTERDSVRKIGDPVPFV